MIHSKNLNSKIHRTVAEMANYHRLAETGLTDDALKKASQRFCYVECITPPPEHPADKEYLSIEFKLEITGLNEDVKERLWIGGDGELTDSPESAKKVSTGWNYSREERNELRQLAFEGVSKCKEIARKLGVPKNAKIYDNIQ
jgi:hypothetical protein